MQVLDREAQERAAEQRKFPDFETGDLLELTLVCHPCNTRSSLSRHKSSPCAYCT